LNYTVPMRIIVAQCQQRSHNPPSLTGNKLNVMENKNIMEENNSDNCAYIQIQETEHDPESIQHRWILYKRQV
jgi:hypothetical protein